MADNATIDFPCGRGDLLEKIGCILTYAGSPKDIYLNYVVLLIHVVYCVVYLRNVNEAKRKDKISVSIGTFAFVVFFQIVLCVILGCDGISIIWCACGGWIMAERHQAAEASHEDGEAQRKNLDQAAQMIILIDCGVIIYYGVVAPPITTVAHICALILGATLSILGNRIVENQNGSLVDLFSSLRSHNSIGSGQPLLESSTST